jgi:hypothetical protein
MQPLALPRTSAVVLARSACVKGEHCKGRMAQIDELATRWHRRPTAPTRDINICAELTNIDGGQRAGAPRDTVVAQHDRIAQLPAGTLVSMCMRCIQVRRYTSVPNVPFKIRPTRRSLSCHGCTAGPRRQGRESQDASGRRPGNIRMIGSWIPGLTISVQFTSRCSDATSLRAPHCVCPSRPSS